MWQTLPFSFLLSPCLPGSIFCSSQHFHGCQFLVSNLAKAGLCKPSLLPQSVSGSFMLHCSWGPILSQGRLAAFVQPLTHLGCGALFGTPVRHSVQVLTCPWPHKASVVHASSLTGSQSPACLGSSCTLAGVTGPYLTPSLASLRLHSQPHLHITAFPPLLFASLSLTFGCFLVMGGWIS